MSKLNLNKYDFLNTDEDELDNIKELERTSMSRKELKSSHQRENHSVWDPLHK